MTNSQQQSTPVSPPAQVDYAALGVASVVNPPKPRRNSWTATELQDASFPEPPWLIPGLIPTGLTILGGKRKIGKSWLALQLAGAVGAGGKFLGLPVTCGKVLYLALEDTGRRLQDRMSKQHWGRGVTVDFHLVWDSLDAGGLVTLQDAIKRGGYTLVVIDTLSRAIGTRPDQMSVGDMTAVMGNLQRLGQETGCAILVLDHHAKGRGLEGAEDPVDDILGSSAKGAVADALAGLYRERGKRGAKLILTGRDLEDVILNLEFDTTTFSWQEAITGPFLTDRQQEIYDALAAGPLSAAKIATVTGQERKNCHSRIQDMVNTHVLDFDGKLYSRV